jgi:ribosomal protein S12 methylthiotransferase
MLENKLFALVSLGCDKNRVDSEKLMGLIAEHGCALTDDLEEANIIVVNTCAFLNSARKEAIDTVLDCNAYRGGNLEKIVVTGCLPQKFADELVGKLTEADVFLGTNDYDKIFEGLERAYAEEGQVNLVGCGNGQFRAERVQSTAEHYAYLKIADGCFNRCTYCLIPKIRGSYRSYPIENLLKEAEDLGELSELILVAQDVTRYGEENGENKLVELLQRLSALENIGHIRLLYCYPEAVSDELIAEMKRNPKIYHYLDIPLQHSEDRILKLMNRKGTRRSYLDLFRKLRKEIPDICIRSTFIAGFPTETEEEHENMKAFLKEATLDNCGFFAYSKEPDTPAAKLKGQILQSEKNRRVKALYKTQAEVSAKKLKEMRGKTVTVVCDGIDYERECFVGRSYKNAPEIDGKVYFHAMEAVQGKEYEIKINQTDSYDLYGCTKEYQDETNH